MSMSRKGRRKRREKDVRTTHDLERRAEDPEVWWWCLHCNRFFQSKHLRVDFLGYRAECPFCSAAGLGVDIFEWDEWWRKGWPMHEADLHYGLMAH